MTCGRVGGMPVGEVKAVAGDGVLGGEVDGRAGDGGDLATGAVEAVTAKEEAAVAEETRDGGGSLCRHM